MTSPLPGKLSLLTDGHVHTKYCHHARGEMEEYVLSAISKGLKEIIFLEHMEAGVQYFESTWLTETDFDIYFAEGQLLQKKYAHKIKISLGVEVGYSPTHKEELLERLAKRKWDRVGVSYHYIPQVKGTQHLNLLSRKEQNIRAIKTIGCKQTLKDYFETLTEAVQVLPGTVLCHLDAALRFQPGINIDEEYTGQISTLLKEVKRKGMALEINTSGFPIRGIPFPAPFIIHEALLLGIPLLPGSDAHKPEDVGRDFDLLPSYLKNI
ncbi:MAG: histidinol-phosphatase HisJ family protein [Desulfocapsa sp.]|uniref:Histidinol-phosphatase n=1 Tax=Desulfotalea psychrophila TaxID=84980 RepID=A0ABS3AYQ7_9BACT|nr:histidinol-phosphatase HisJ family protein [Desulfocapsa sp.]MBN4068455.1 histidinol-phosphatase HisJ family protein [Desulfotalea psychrophila]